MGDRRSALVCAVEAAFQGRRKNFLAHAWRQRSRPLTTPLRSGFGALRRGGTPVLRDILFVRCNDHGTPNYLQETDCEGSCLTDVGRDVSCPETRRSVKEQSVI